MSILRWKGAFEKAESNIDFFMDVSNGELSEDGVSVSFEGFFVARYEDEKVLYECGDAVGDKLTEDICEANLFCTGFEAFFWSGCSHEHAVLRISFDEVISAIAEFGEKSAKLMLKLNDEDNHEYFRKRQERIDKLREEAK